MKVKLKRENVLVFDDNWIPLVHVIKSLKLDRDTLLKEYEPYIIKADPTYRGFGNTYITHVISIEGVRKLYPDFQFAKQIGRYTDEDFAKDRERALNEYKASPQYKIDCAEYLKRDLEMKMESALEISKRFTE